MARHLRVTRHWFSGEGGVGVILAYPVFPVRVEARCSGAKGSDETGGTVETLLTLLLSVFVYLPYYCLFSFTYPTTVCFRLLTLLLSVFVYLPYYCLSSFSVTVVVDKMQHDWTFLGYAGT